VKLGFAGIGRMGEPIALRLLGAGFRVTVWNRSREKLSKVLAAGAVAAKDLPQLAADSDAIFTMVTDDAAVDEVYRGSSGLLSFPDVRGKLFADMSTVLPTTVKSIAASVRERGAAFIDAPVAGTVQPAREGRLLVFAGGHPADIEKLKPAFDAIARRVEYLGPVGSGAAMKLIHNALLTTYWSGLAEASEMGIRYGLDFKRMLDVIVESPAALAALAVKMPALLGSTPEVGFNIANVKKDLRTITSFAEDLGVAAPIVHAVQQAFENAVKDGLGLEDVAAIVKRAASHSGD
jgi:3-hydroxyisobutyrate dehydrogenase-like beta-hydroxyacid dehydrogenase